MAEVIGKVLIVVHGRKWKPLEDDLAELWWSALRYGIERDFGEGSPQAKSFEAVQKKFVYYGDLSKEFFTERNKGYNRPKDTEARRKTLDELKTYIEEDFSEETYREIRPLRHRVRTKVYGGFAAFAGAFRLPNVVARAVIPDVCDYWEGKAPFGTGVKQRMEEALLPELRDERDVLVVAHSLGSMLAYDAMCRAEAAENVDGELTRLVTIGSPMGIPYVQRRLANWRDHPTNIMAWDHVTAKDDYVSLDRTIEDDFHGMPAVTDHKVFNLAVKFGKAHQHHATGYLIHPVVADLVGGWLA